MGKFFIIKFFDTPVLVGGKVLEIKTEVGIKKIGLRKCESEKYSITDIDTGTLLATELSEVALVWNYLEASEFAKNFYEDGHYAVKKLTKSYSRCKEIIDAQYDKN